MDFDEIILTQEEYSALKKLIEITKGDGIVYVEDANRELLDRFVGLGFAELMILPKFDPHAPRESNRRFSAPRGAKPTEKGLRYMLYLADREKEKAELQAKEASEKAERFAREKRERRFSLLQSLISAAVGSLVTLFVEHFHEICLFFHSLF